MPTVMRSPGACIGGALLLLVAISGCTAQGPSAGTASSSAAASGAAPSPSPSPSGTAPSPAPSRSATRAEASAAAALGDAVAAATELPAAAASDYDAYVVRESPGRGTTLDVPAEWTMSRTDTDDGGEFVAFGPSAEFDTAHPNVFVYVDAARTPAALLETKRSSYQDVCADVSTQHRYDDGRSTGVFRVYTGCIDPNDATGGDTTLVDVAVRAKDSSTRTVMLDFTVKDQRDVAAVDRAIRSLGFGG